MRRLSWRHDGKEAGVQLARPDRTSGRKGSQAVARRATAAKRSLESTRPAQPGCRKALAPADQGEGITKLLDAKE